MSAQRLGPRKIRQLERQLGEPIRMAWVHGGTGGWVNFVTLDHRHGSIQRPTGAVEWYESDQPRQHYMPACEQLFPGWKLR